MDKPLWAWAVFAVIVITALILDLGVLHRKSRAIGVRESLLLSGGYVLLGLGFGAFVWLEMGSAAGKAYLTGYLVEKSLSVDNIFVISLIFTYFSIPAQYQHRVLFWGILGVILLRGIMISLGAVVVHHAEWVLLLFAGFLVYSGIYMIISMQNEKPMDLAKSKSLKWLRKHLPITEELHGSKFSVLLPHAQNPNKKVRYYTPLLLALCMIELIDLMFAVDSIPAVFAITTDPYLVFTSNIFAVLGLRALYFALGAVLDRFHYLQYALAMILVFIGGKVLIAEFLGLEKIPPGISLTVTVALLAGGIAYSWAKTRDEAASK